ncbi:MAG: glycoside hydrolase family 3 N-terminal domain-containing protein, partial [Longimicrobiales bacterium]|nr:glycoside hydrolase family 3 N-terminal domain-containing protein [Longimicrobiales bacterium]
MHAIVRVLLLVLVALPTAVRAQDATGAEQPTATEQRVEALLARMTLGDKLSLLGGVNIFDVPGLPNLGLPRLGTADGPFGIRAAGPATVYPGGIGLAATWNPVLVEGVGRQMGRDARARGKHFHLAPGVNLYRSPLNGRNFEYYGEDPYLAARTAVAFIQGVQSQGVSSTVKHWVGNNSEFMRHSSDSRIDERALRELYLPAFEAAVKEADVGAVMAAYNLTNGERMTAHERLNLGVLKGEWGFDGVLMSDWGATYDGLAAATAGLDLEMPGPRHMHPDTLRRFLETGLLDEATIDDKVRRLLRTEVRFGWPDRPQLDPGIPRDNPAGRVVALEAAIEGMVLLKNEGSTLPLEDNIGRVAVLGPNADPTPVVGGGSASVLPIEPVSFLDGITARLGAERVTYHPGLPDLQAAARATRFTTPEDEPGLRVEVFDGMALEGAPTSTRIDSFVDLGQPLDLAVIFSNPGGANLLALMPTGPRSIRWTGTYTPAQPGEYDFFVQQGGFSDAGARLYVDGEKLTDT